MSAGRCSGILGVTRPLKDAVMHRMKPTGRDRSGAAEKVLARSNIVTDIATRLNLDLARFPKTRYLVGGVANNDTLNFSPGSGDFKVVSKVGTLPDPHGNMLK